MISMRFDVLTDYACGGSAPPVPLSSSPISRFTAFNSIDLKAQATESVCAYTVHMRFDPTKVIFLQSSVEARDEMDLGVGQKLIFHYFDDGSGTVPVDTSLVTGLAFANTTVKVSRTTVTDVLEHPFQSPEITPCSYDPKHGLTYSLTATDSSSPNLTLDSTTFPTKIVIPSLAGLSTATHTYTVSVVSDFHASISASYTLEFTVRADCGVGKSIEKDIFTMPEHIYMELWHEMLLTPKFSEPSGCPIMYEASVCVKCTYGIISYHQGSFDKLTGELRQIHTRIDASYIELEEMDTTITAYIDGYKSTSSVDYNFIREIRDPSLNDHECDYTQIII